MGYFKEDNKMTQDKKQELIEKITKMLEPYEDVIEYSFKVNLYFKRNEYMYNHVVVSYNDLPMTPTPFMYAGEEYKC